MECLQTRVFWSLGLVILAVTTSTVDGDCNAFYINGKDSHTPGKCTTFQECPILFDMVKSPYKTNKEIELLQQLTCQPVIDINNPHVCCSLDEIVGFNFNDRNLPSHPVKPQNLDNDDGKLIFETVNKGSFPEQAVHAGFRLLPPLTECGSSFNPDRIVGGESASIIEFPWLVRIGYISHFEDDEIKYLCAGTIINKRYILTAAHCTQEINPEEYEPSVIRLATKDEICDDVYGCSEPIDIKIKKIIAHPKYNKKTKENDIGLIRLDEDIPFEIKMNKIFMRPVCLPFAEEYGLTKSELDPSLQKVIESKKPSEWAQVAGWGKTHWNKNEGSEFLQKIRLPVISRDQCQKNYESHTRVNISDKQYCVGGEVGKDSCGGDSGGGFYITHNLRLNAKQSTVKTFQYGVVSFGPIQCGVGDLPGVYSNVYAYKNWILDHLEP